MMMAANFLQCLYEFMNLMALLQITIPVIPKYK